MSEQVTPPPPADSVQQLRTELALARRTLRQVQRVAATSETMALQSKRAMLRMHEELQARIQELRHAKSQAEQASIAKGRFLATMSHELRTPLHGMVGSAELLLGMTLSPEQTELVQLLHRSGTALLATVNDILDYSRIEAGQMLVERIPFLLTECVNGVIDLQRQPARQKGLELRLLIDEQVPAAVVGDPGRIRQVLLNLVHNALKFTPKGSIEVRIQCTEDPEVLRFGVSDTGIGIQQAALERIFEAFVQEDASTTRKFGGTGLGLAISKQLVGLMGGAIHAESTPGKGTTFWFTCRLPKTDLQSVHPNSATPTHAASDGQRRRGRVLVVDDHSGNRMLVGKMLDRLHCEHEAAEDGVQALQRIAHGTFDLVLMDCSMPVMDGYDATRAIRALPGHMNSIPVIALTAYAMPGDEKVCLEAGMDGYLTKPLRLQDLTGVLDRYLQRRPG